MNDADRQRALHSVGPDDVPTLQALLQRLTGEDWRPRSRWPRSAPDARTIERTMQVELDVMRFVARSAYDHGDITLRATVAWMPTNNYTPSAIVGDQHRIRRELSEQIRDQIQRLYDDEADQREAAAQAAF